jgi:hypothetical protein
VAVADILYLAPEGAPHVFVPPEDAMTGTERLRDKRGYTFDAVSPRILMQRAGVVDGHIHFPGGTSYCLLVLPRLSTMTPQLLDKLIELVDQGAVLLGMPPEASPGLRDYPQCDEQVRKRAEVLWGLEEEMDRRVGKGRVIRDVPVEDTGMTSVYPDYKDAAAILRGMGVPPDFEANAPIRYGHRRTEDSDIYFLSNTSEETVQSCCRFRVDGGDPELWHPVDGRTRVLPEFNREGGITQLPLSFHAHESFFVVFSDGPMAGKNPSGIPRNVESPEPVFTLEGAWNVSFSPERGGPEHTVFNHLQDWTLHPERGIKYYSGSALYRKTFEGTWSTESRSFLDLGAVHDMARVRLNGQDLGTVWCAPWRVEVTECLEQGENHLEIEIANRWVNRLIGDQQDPDKEIRTLSWESGLLAGKEFKTGRYTFSTKSGPESLLPAGLLGPVRILDLNAGSSLPAEETKWANLNLA